jgi:hypothetical protein
MGRTGAIGFRLGSGPEPCAAHCDHQKNDGHHPRQVTSPEYLYVIVLLIRCLPKAGVSRPIMHWKIIALSLLAIAAGSEDTFTGKGYRTVAYFVNWYAYTEEQEFRLRIMTGLSTPTSRHKTSLLATLLTFCMLSRMSTRTRVRCK